MASPEENLENRVQELLSKIENGKSIDLGTIKEAIEFGEKAHLGQQRKNGNPFFIHPVRVAIKATEYNLDTETIVSSLLHDTVEDTEKKEEKVKISEAIRQKFGKTVFALVDSLTKVKEDQHLTLHKIFQLGNIDFRVFLIKLLDRLDNLSDVNYLSRRKQRRVCLETISLYTEVAHGLGLIEIEEGLKDLVFQHMYPVSYRRISNDLKQFYYERRVAIQQIIEELKGCIDPGYLISITPQYSEPQEYLYNRQEIVRILNSVVIQVSDPINCYQVLGNIHTNFRSVPLNICDYISNPKANGWRGLSTKVIVAGEQIQIHIVTEEFHRNNRKGVLTLINEGVFHSDTYRRFLQLYLDVASDNLRIEDVFRASKTKTIQTLTPNGDVIELRHGATILDFAFTVHTELGLKSIGGIIDNVRYPRNKILEAGMVVSVIKSDSILPEQNWIYDVVMPKSRKEILKYLNQQN